MREKIAEILSKLILLSPKKGYDKRTFHKHADGSGWYVELEVGTVLPPVVKKYLDGSNYGYIFNKMPGKFDPMTGEQAPPGITIGPRKCLNLKELQKEVDASTLIIE